MNKSMSKLLPSTIIGLLLVVMVTGSGLAAVPGQGPILQERVSRGIPYLSGGSTPDERHEMTNMSKQFNLKLVFAKWSGEYISKVEVVIQDPGRKDLVVTESNGPWFFAKLPRGHYKVLVNYNGRHWESREISVGKQLQTDTFRWS
jgi:hypothetical protein